MVHTSVVLASDSPWGAVAVAHSGRLSRVWRFNTQSIELESGPYLKARLTLHDLSSDGEFLTYEVEAHHRPLTSYLAVSRCPHLRALGLWRTHHLAPNRCAFEGKTLRVRRVISPKQARDRVLQPAALELSVEDLEWSGCPWREHLSSTPICEKARVLEAVAQACPDMNDASPKHEMSWSRDRSGRLWVATRGALFAIDGQECTARQVLPEPHFEEFPAPAWARSWSDPRC